MECFIKKIIEGKIDESVHKQFIKFGRGEYKRRFVISFNKGSKIKVKGSFEFINEFVKFVRESKNILFSGKILMKEQIPGKDSKKKGGSYVYEVSESSLEEFENAYYYLLDANDNEITLKIKKNVPKPGKEKIDNNFCLMELDLKYWEKLKQSFFWDVPESKKALIEHNIVITDINIPKDEENPAKMRETAVRKGKIIRKISVGGEESIKEIEFEA